jgi:hypothetical protein
VETKRQHKLIEETILQHQAKQQTTNSDSLPRPLRQGHVVQSGSSSNVSSSTLICLPLLTNTKQTLLNKHDGCAKCQHFYTDHCSQSCLNSFPVGKGYKMLTTADAFTTKKAKAVSKPTVKTQSCSRHLCLY